MKVKKLTAGLLAVAITVSLIAPEAFAKISGANSVGKVTVSGLTVDTPIKSASGDTGETKEPSEPSEPSEDESVYTYGVLEDGTIEILGYNGSGGNVVIPAEIDGKSVTSIGSYAFSDHTELTSITIPNSVKSIDDGAFFRCYHLKSIIIPDSVTSIGNFAFCGCSDLESIEIPDGVTSIGNGTFMWCSSLESIMIPDSVTSIATDAFNSCKSVSGITIPKNVTEIGLRAFADCASLTEIKVSDENSNYASVDGVLYNKDKTSVVCYPAGIKDSNYKIIDGVTTIERESFYDCTELTSVTVPDSVTCISGEAFKSCTNLTSITLPDSAMYIDNWAFYNCTSLKEVTIPASVTAIGDEAFGYCYDGDSSETKKVDGFKINYAKNTYGHLYAVKNGFSDEIYLVTNELDDGTLTIAKYAGNSATYEIPAEIDGKKVTDICNGAFSDCTELTNVTIPDGVKHIGYDAFYNCTSLETVTIPASVTYIYDKAFLNCTSLAAVSLPASVISVGDKAFGYYQDDNYEIKAVDGFKINYIKNTWGHWYATRNGFSDETCLVTSELYNGTLQIDGYAGNSSTYVIPDEIDGKTVTQIVNNAFNDCISLKEVTIPASVTDASWSALGYYYDRDSMETKKVDGFKINYVKNTWGHMYAVRNGFTDEACLITTELDDGTIEISEYYGINETYIIPSEIDGKKVTEIGEQAFRNNTALTNVTIPDTVTRIGRLTFCGCKALTSIKIPDSVIEIEDFAFEECDSLKNVSIPASVTSIGMCAFGYTYDEGINRKKVDGFTLEYVKNTAGHLYAALNDFTDESYFVTEELEDGTLSISRYYAKDETYTIPPEINGKKVTQIKQYAFARNKYLKSIVISENVKEIGQHAFSGCTALTDVSIPDSVTKIDARAFVNCTSILNVCVPASVTFIGEQAFGYEYDDLGYEGKIKGFNIKCYKGTAGEQYAKDNGFDYEILDSETQCTHSNTAIRNAVSADCTTEGYTGDTYCADCDELISSGEVIPATGHTEVIDKAVAATCTETGLTEGKHCSVCNTVIKAQEVVPAKGHKYVNTVVKPTYTAKGYTLHKCLVCGTSYKDTYTAKLTLAKVSGVKLGGRAADALRINWTKNASADGYIVEIYQNGKWARVAKITNNSTTTFRKAGLKASTVYKFRVRAYKMSGKTAVYGAYSATVAARTNPSVIKGAKLGGRAADALRINWSKNASADGYIVEMYRNGKWARVAKITSNSTTTFRKAGLKASSVYKFRVRAYKMSGKTALYGNYSAAVTARTNPSVVKGFKIGGKAKDALRVNWTKNSSAQGYIVERYKGGKWVRGAKITNSNTTTFRKAGLAKNTAYKFRVRAYHMSGKTALYGNYGSVSGKTAAK